MGLESASSINDLVATNPVGGTDPKGEGDDHLRMIKSVLKACFPGLSGALGRKVSKTANFNVVKTDNTVFFDCSGTIVLTMDAAATLGAGHSFGFYVRSGTVQIDPNAAELVNGASSIVLTAGAWGFVFCSGTDFTAVGNFALPDGVIVPAWPIGSVFVSVSSVNPASTIGYGTWVAFGTGKAIVGIDPANTLMDTVEETFGVPDTVLPSHTHTINDPGHYHIYNELINGAGFATGNNDRHINQSATNSAVTGISVNTAGVAATNKNYQPSIAVYLWKRTA